MLTVRLLVRLLGVALMVGGVLSATVMSRADVVVESAHGDTEVPSEVEVNKEKTLVASPEPGALASSRAEALVAHAAVHSVSRGAPPTPPPEA